ncbi:MAG: hypothetical protein U0Q03_20165 [Acidimicrobiales bacterium]
MNRTTTRTMLTAAVATLALLTAACGSDDSGDSKGDSATTEAADATATTAAGDTATTEAGGSSSGGDLVQQAVDKAVSEAEADGVTLDRDCVAEVASRLSEADLQMIADAPAGEDVALSAEGEAVAIDILTCAPREQLVDQMVGSMAGQDGVDQECVRAIFEGMSDDDLKAMVTSAGDTTSEQFNDLMTQMMTCITAST